MIFNQQKPIKLEDGSICSENILNNDLRPVIVACSSYIDDHVLLETKKAGFDFAISAPLTTTTIIEDIFPLIEKRELKINHLKNMSLIINSNIDLSLS